ncbi:TPA: hypothetical protein VBD98_001376, partial [Streptococcus agalactiae]|nr:hypothetical protein [Streptococcus agalactiae]HEO7053130.1 hypothetical protein [Streptococcus agalactiae]HEO7149809.1 hypothetical protein [Streptococcus agalactiae]HEO7263887.1 hypothetical protein [Streptococcus agalactiae]HEO7275243.1 hypothetical protein [Streptococcus agalactiae]
LIFSGGFYMKEQQRKEELKRNREYEVSLVKALKNSYSDIKEIQISNPITTTMPGDWRSTVKIIFSDNDEITYCITHNKDDEINRSGSINEKEHLFLSKTKYKFLIIFLYFLKCS